MALYADLILRQIQKVLEREATPESFCALAQIVVPEVAEKDLYASADQRKKAWQQLQVRVHPDKHSDNPDLSKTVFQKLMDFKKQIERKEYIHQIDWSRPAKSSAIHGASGELNGSISKGSRWAASATFENEHARFPNSFSIVEKWPWISTPVRDNARGIQYAQREAPDTWSNNAFGNLVRYDAPPFQNGASSASTNINGRGRETSSTFGGMKFGSGAAESSSAATYSTTGGNASMPSAPWQNDTKHQNLFGKTSIFGGDRAAFGGKANNVFGGAAAERRGDRGGGASASSSGFASRPRNASSKAKPKSSGDHCAWLGEVHQDVAQACVNSRAAIACGRNIGLFVRGPEGNSVPLIVHIFE